MEESEHTPGPWHSRPRQTENGCPMVWSPDGSIAAVTWRSSPQGQSEANARLIASAPELIEPFDGVDDADWEWLFTHLEVGGHGLFWREVFRNLRHAISKATGG